MQVAQSEVMLWAYTWRWVSVRGQFSSNIGWDPSASKSNRLHGEIFAFFYIKFKYRFKWSVIVLKSLNCSFLNSTGSSVSIVEAPILDQDPIGNPRIIGTSIKLGFNFNQAKTNSAMIRVVVLSGDEQLWHILDIDNMFGPIFDFKISQ